MPPKAQTIKQAKAAYKARNQPTLTDREKKRLERSAELDRRAWRIREAEKRKVEAKAKRGEKEAKERVERDIAAGMTSQRRCDRFGFVASQMHLGAFFGGGGAGGGVDGGAGGSAGGRVEEHGGPPQAEDVEAFDEDLDDETMLGALSSGDTEKASTAEQLALEARSGARLPDGGHTAAQVLQAPGETTGDLDSFWDELDSSTQIARDLATEPPKKLSAGPTSPTDSFGSGEFDLSVEDIEDAQIKGAEARRSEIDKKLMPPPALPIKSASITPAMGPPAPPISKQCMPLPAQSTKPLANNRANGPAVGALPPRPPHPQQKPAFPSKPAGKQKPARRDRSPPPIFAPGHPMNHILEGPYNRGHRMNDVIAALKRKERKERATKNARPFGQNAAQDDRLAAKNSAPAHTLGFTMAELESFVDDDLQLTQVDPV